MLIEAMLTALSKLADMYEGLSIAEYVPQDVTVIGIDKGNKETEHNEAYFNQAVDRASMLAKMIRATVNSYKDDTIRTPFHVNEIGRMLNNAISDLDLEYDIGEFSNLREKKKINREINGCILAIYEMYHKFPVKLRHVMISRDAQVEILSTIECAEDAGFYIPDYKSDMASLEKRFKEVSIVKHKLSAVYANGISYSCNDTLSSDKIQNDIMDRPADGYKPDSNSSANTQYTPSESCEPYPNGTPCHIGGNL